MGYDIAALFLFCLFYCVVVVACLITGGGRYRGHERVAYYDDCGWGKIREDHYDDGGWGKIREDHNEVGNERWLIKTRA